jgi:hypothetical protein
MKTAFAVFVFALTSAASAQDYRRRQVKAAERAREALQPRNWCSSTVLPPISVERR